MENLLLIDRVRRKEKSFFSLFETDYYKSEKIPFKEKVYTFLYCMERTGFTTQGEQSWFERMFEIDSKKWLELEKEFKKDYAEFEMNDKKLLQTP